MLIWNKLFLKGYFCPKQKKWPSLSNSIHSNKSRDISWFLCLLNCFILVPSWIFLSHHESCFQSEVIGEITVSLEPWILFHVYLTWEAKSSCIYTCRVLQLRKNYIWNQLRDLIRKKKFVCDLTLSVNAEWGVVEIILLITSVKPFESSLKIIFY